MLVMRKTICSAWMDDDDDDDDRRTNDSGHKTHRGHPVIQLQNLLYDPGLGTETYLLPALEPMTFCNFVRTFCSSTQKFLYILRLNDCHSCLSHPLNLLNKSIPRQSHNSESVLIYIWVVHPASVVVQWICKKCSYCSHLFLDAKLK